MNKLISFFVSAIIAIAITAGFYWNIPVREIDPVPVLIYWYMIWKLLHDKNKD